MLAVAIWNNVVFPLDVRGDQPASVDPLDVLTLINEINNPRFSDASGRLPKQTAEPQNGPFLDVDCDSFVSPLDVLVVINHLNAVGPGVGGGIASNGGTYANSACSPQLLEGTGFVTELTRVLKVPRVNSALEIRFEAPSFDAASLHQIRDAFEIEIRDTNGNPIVLPIRPNQDAVFSWSEGLPPTMASGVANGSNTSGGYLTATVNLSSIATDTQIQVATRLVNNDQDNGSLVVIRGYEFVNATPSTPSSVTGQGNALRSVARFDPQEQSNVSGSVVASYGRTSLSADNNELIAELTLTNVGNQAVRGPLFVVFDNFSDLEVSAMQPDGILPDGRPYLDITSQLSGSALAPGQSILSREIRFLNNSAQRFSYQLRVFGRLNSAPSGFTSVPLDSIQVDRTYRYQAKATDQDSDALDYSVETGPVELAIHPLTGEVTWVPNTAAIGSHIVTLRGTDPFGLFVEQTFTINVLEDQQNRPPNFVTDPVTEAIASSGFEITTVASGAHPAGVAVISGFQGPRLVAINAGDQTVGVYAGKNNDRFDEATTISTGEPKPTDAVFQSGYGVDVGLPQFLLAGDSNDVLGMDQGDFNGDGILDLAVITSADPSGATRPTYAFAILLGDGDGNFRQPQIIPIAANVTASYKHLNAADLNGDGNLDVIVINETNGSATTILGNGDGTFGPLRVQTLSVSMNDYRLADINKDGILDLYGRNFNRSLFGWLPGIGDGTYRDFIPVSGADSNTNANQNYLTKPYQAVDLDGDGDLDFVIGKSTGSLIELWTNGGSQNFVLAGTLVGLRRASTQLQGVTDLRVADFTGDGILDIFYSGTDRDGYSIYVGSATPLLFTYRDASVSVGNFAGEANPAGDDRPLDFDGDGDLDLVMGNGHEGEKYAVRVLINNGSGFFTVTDYASVDFRGQETEIRQNSIDTNIVAGVLVGDYNRDGVVDLSYYTRGDNDFNGVGIIPGTRPGEFYGSRTTEFPTDFEALAADFNGDGIIDLLSIKSAIVLIGNGDGTFQPGFPAVSVPNRAGNAQIADFNRDGILDLIASRSQGFYVALGNGNGTFNVSFNTAIPGSFYGYGHISNGDFNNDGLPDIIGRAGVEKFIDVWLNQADNPGTFVNSFHLPILGSGTLTQGFQHSVAEGDFNEDGFLDFAAGSLLESDNSLNSLKIYSGAGDGTFTLTHEQASYNDAFLGSNYYPGEFQSGDVNEDGHLDLVSFTTGGPVVHLGMGDGTFRFLDQYFTDSGDVSAKDSYLVDTDQDGHLDMVQLVFVDSVNVRRGRGDGTFNDPIRLDSIGRTNSASFADLDHDGHLDLVYARRNTNGGGAYGAANLYLGVRDTLVDVLAVDLNGDGNQEILAINEANDRLKLFVGDNLGGLTRQRDLLTGRAPRAVTTADLDGDGKLELITANRAGRSLSVFSGSIATGYASIEFPLENGAIDIAAADLDGDGRPDLVALDDTDNALWIYTGNGTSILATPVALALGDVASKLTLADATGDGLIDAIITLPKTNRLMILPNRGLGFQPEIFGAPIYITLTSSPSDVQVVDLNDDGHPDLAATLPATNTLSVLFGRGNNQFARAQQIAVGSEPTRVVLADADEDGRTDLIVTNSGDNTISVIYNRFDPNEVYRYDSDAIDPDGDTITYAIEDGPGGLIINSSTGQLLWAASPDQVGAHNVTLSANDGRGGTATQSFKIQVEPARENALPLIATVPDTKIGAGDTFAYQATAIDNDRDTIRYRLIDAPAGASIDPTTGLVEWDGRTDQGIIFGATNGSLQIGADESYSTPSTTIEGWYNIHTLTASNGAEFLFSKRYQTGHSYAVRVLFNSTLELSMRSDTGTTTFRMPFAQVVDRWYHIALTVDDASRTAIVYVDGQAIGQTAIAGPITYSASEPFFITGGQTIIDNFRIWNYARTTAEIREGMDRQYTGDSRVVVDYRFDDINAFSVRDYSPAGNTGFRVVSGGAPELAPGLANSGMHPFTIGVEDGRGGYDEQSFNVEILPEFRGRISGRLTDTSSSNAALLGWQVFIDTNNNAFRDPSEPQAITNATGNYSFAGLLPGSYPLRVSPTAGFVTPAFQNVSVIANQTAANDIAIAQLALSQIRGKLKTENDTAIANWGVYADLDNDGVRDDDEPFAASDRNGNFALAGLAAGTYRVRPDLPAGWADVAGRDGLLVTLATDAIFANNNFTLRPTNTSVTGGVHFVTKPNTDIIARQVFRYASIATSIDGSAIVYDLSLAPAGMSIDPSSGLVAWRPSIAQVGEHLVILRATDRTGSITLQDFSITVAAPNTVPVIHRGIGILPVGRTAYVGHVYSYDIIAQDAESTALTYTLSQSPTGAVIDSATGRITWTPAASAVGSQDFSVVVADEAGGSTMFSWTVNVENTVPVNLPLIVMLPRATATVTTDYFSRITATDNLGQPVTWALASGPVGLAVQSDGTIRWTPSVSQLGTQAIEISATTADGNEQLVSFDIKVTGRLFNASPVIESTPHRSISLGQTFTYDLKVSDTDRDIFAFTLLESPIGMSIHSSLGTIRWTPVADQLGESNVVIQVTDPSGATATQEFKLKVSRFGGPPRITSVPPTEAGVGGAYFYSVMAIDAENDPLSYSLLAAPNGLTIVETTGEIVWTPTGDQLGEQDIVIQVSDGIGGAVTQAFVIRVNAGASNLPPVIQSSSPRFGAVGTPYTYSIVATDPESTAITYSLGRGPTGLTVDATTGLVRWTPAVDQTGKFVITLIATDAGGASAVESFEFDVLAQNIAPVINSNAPVDVAAGAEFRYDVLAKDANIDQLRFELLTSPAGATIDSFGRIRWQTNTSLIGSHDFTLRVSDPRGGEAMQNFMLAVIEDTIAPKLSSIVTPGENAVGNKPWGPSFVLYVRAIDNVAISSLTLTANGRDIPLNAAGTATFTFEEWRFTRINTIARAVDTNGNVTEKSVVFDYDFPEGWGGSDPQVIPTAIITSPANTASVTGMVSIVGTAAHADFAAYKLSYRRVDQTEFTEFFESTTAVTNGTLGVWDTSLLLNDEYVIRLEVATNAGVVNVVENNLGLAGELKLGNFRLSFTDMVIPVAGIPIEITRIYDTLQADREGDFGFGWRLEYRNTDLQVGLPRSGLEDIGIFSALREGVKVYLNVPGEGRQGFTFTPDIRVLPGFGGTNLVLARPRFTPDPGVTARLSAGTSSYLQVNERGELHAPGGIPYNPASPDFGGAYVLTTRDGTTYRINGSTGNLESAIDRNKNTLLYTDDGIFQFVIEGASSVAIAISRDSLGHITEIRDPAGESFYYAYANNRIIESRDQLGNTTQYVYESIGSNRLLSVLDSLGRVGIRSEYDAEGRLSAYIGANGQRIDLQFNSSNRIQSITDPLGNETLVGLDQYGNEVLERDSLGNSITRTFDSKNQIETVTDKLGNTSRYKYNAFGDVISRTDSAGNMVRFEYNPRGDIVSSLNAQGARSETQRDTAGNATRIVDASGLTTDIRYDAKGNATAFNGVLNRTSLKYNSHGFISKEVDSRGNLQQHDFDSLGRVTRSTTQLADGRLAVESKLFDASGNLIKSTDAMGGSTEYSYNSVGQLIARKDLLGIETSYAYDVEGRLVKTIFADATPLDNTDNPFVATKYDAIGRPVESIDELGRIAKFVYDALGNLIEEQYPDSTISDEDNPRRKFEYDANGRLLASISELGSRTEYTYDSVGNRVTFRNAAGQLWRFEYDSTGRRTSQFDPAGNRTQFRYDAAGKLIGQSFPDDSSAALEVNTSQRSYSKTERDGSKILSEYSENSELIRSVDESGAAWAFVYDSFGNLASITNAQGNTTIDSFDLLGRPVRSTKPTGDSSSARYDAVGNIVESIDYNGSVTRYSYDARYRLIEVNYADTSTTRYEYDLVGNRTAIVGENGRTEFQYDERYRLVQQLNPDQTWIRYEYDLASNRAAIITPFGRTGYQFDLLNRISRVIAPDDGQTNYQYNELGLLINTNFANGVIEKRSYDSRGYVLAIETTNRETSIAKWTYQYNVLGQRTSATNSDRSSVNYTYDPTGRIIREAYRSPALIETRVVEYAYDSVGNRIKKTENGASVTLYTYDRNDRLVRLESNGNASTFQYDANGNLVGESTNGISVKAYRFDRRDRLDAVDGNGDGQFEINYAYDELGNRTSKTVNGSTTNYLVDSLRQNAEVIAEYRDPQVADVIYVFGNRLLTQLRAETAAFYHTDGLGSVRVLTTQSGVVANEYEFSAFGELLLSSGTTVNDYLFAGQRRDAETGLDYLRARYLNSVVGRFISQDPFPAQIQRTNAINGYAYAEGNPLTLVDPSGLTTSTAELSVVQTIIQGISKGTGSFRAAKAIKQRAEIAHQVVFLVSAGIHAAVFYLIDLKFPLPGTVEADVSIGFVHETSSDLWVKKVKLSLNPLKKETEIEIGLGRIGAEKKGDKGVDPSIGIKFCGGSICGSKIGLSYDIVTIPQAKRGADGDLDGALLAIAAKAEAGVARDRSKPSKQQISGDVTFGFEAVAFGTLKYSAKLFSAQAIANLFNKK